MIYKLHINHYNCDTYNDKHNNITKCKSKDTDYNSTVHRVACDIYDVQCIQQSCMTCEDQLQNDFILNFVVYYH